MLKLCKNFSELEDYLLESKVITPVEKYLIEKGFYERTQRNNFIVKNVPIKIIHGENKLNYIVNC